MPHNRTGTRPPPPPIHAAAYVRPWFLRPGRFLSRPSCLGQLALRGVITGRISYFRPSVKEHRLALNKDWVPPPDCGPASTEDKDKGEDSTISATHFISQSTLSLVWQWRPLFQVVCRIAGLCTIWLRACGPHLLDLSFFFFEWRIHSLFILHVITSRRPLWWRRFWPLIGASTTTVPFLLFPPVRSSCLFSTPSIHSGNSLSPPFVTTFPSSLPSTFSHPLPQTLIIPVNPQRMSGVFNIFPSSGPSSRIPSPEGPSVWNVSQWWRITIMTQKQPPTPTRSSPPTSSLCQYVPLELFKKDHDKGWVTESQRQYYCSNYGITAPQNCWIW